MDTQLFGDLLWNTLAVISRECDQITKCGLPCATEVVRFFVLLAYALQHVMPCVFCRTSYQHYLADLPPDAFVGWWTCPGSPSCAVSQQAGNGRRRKAKRHAPCDTPRPSGHEWSAQEEEEQEENQENQENQEEEEEEVVVEGKKVRASSLQDWVWHMHDRVNAKLGIESMMTKRRFRKKMRVTSALMHPAGVWDLLTIIALNYPVTDDTREEASAAQSNEEVERRTSASRGHCETDATAWLADRFSGPPRHPPRTISERTRRCAAHAVFLQALAVLLEHVPDLGTIARHISPDDAIRSGAFATRDALVGWVCARKRAWMRENQVHASVCARMIDAERAYIASLA
jgi:hypothetical protein